MTAARTAAPRQAPAEEGIWVFVIGDLILFTVFFNVFLYYARAEPELFRRGQQTLSIGFGLLNTALLLTSSWLVVLGLRAVRGSQPLQARRRFAIAMLLGSAFVVVKAIEYGQKLGHGITPGTDIFFTLYFVFTGIHLLHVLLGLAVLALLRRMAAGVETDGRKLRWIESGAIFWHLVDLLWIILFPVIYLVRA